MTHLPYRNLCPICAQGEGRQDNYKKQQSRQPTIQVDFAYIKSQQDPKTVPVLTAVDVTTTACGGSNSQGSVERLHRTLLGQIRVVKAQVESNYGMTMSTKHCLLPWVVRHAAWTVYRYVIHPDGYTSFERRWGRNYERAICEFGETLLYLPPQHKKLPKADLRMQKCTWLGKVSETGENYVATEQGVLRTVRRLQPAFKCDLALLNKVSGTPWAPRWNLQPVIRNTVGLATPSVRTERIYTRRWTTSERDGRHRHGIRNETTTRYVASSPMAASPTGRQHPPLPAPPRQTLRRMTPEEIMQPSKAQKTPKDTTIRSTEEVTKEPKPPRQRNNAVTLSNGTSSLPTQRQKF